ncbi:MAG: hypothetical protein OEY10_07195 [Nitrosopumilus sp.]|nr:hypothetical protein [Nitrosopumilus sp.]
MTLFIVVLVALCGGIIGFAIGQDVGYNKGLNEGFEDGWEQAHSTHTRQEDPRALLNAINMREQSNVFTEGREN